MTTIRRVSTVLAALATVVSPLSAFADGCARVAHASTDIHGASSTAVHWIAPAFVAVVVGLAWRRSVR
jgi:hypothetical protein